MWIMVDVEADGPIPGDYSMISLGAVIVEPGLNRTFFGQFKPCGRFYQEEALKVNGVTREETLSYPDPFDTMVEFDQWLESIKANERLMFISDNNGFDWQFVNYYYWHFLNKNPFGHSSTNLGSLYKGMIKNTFKNFKHLRETKHTHHPVDDAKGNAEAFLKMINELGLKTQIP